MSGIVGGERSKSGIIGAPPDAQKYAWHRYLGADIDMGSGYIDFTHYVFQGSGTTEALGVVTIGPGGAGVYWIGCALSNWNNDPDLSFNLYVEGAIVTGTRLFRGSVSGTYEGEAGSWAVLLNDGDTIGMHGAGYLAGNTSDSMSYFSGCRIGSKS